MIKRKARFGMVDPDVEKPSYEKKAYCKKCFQLARRLSVLQPRYYPDLKPNEPLPQDHDNWRECYTCGTIYPTYNVKVESRLGTAVGSVPLNPFDRDVGYMETVGQGEAGLGRLPKDKQQERKWKAEELDKVKDLDARRLANSGKRLISYRDSNEKT